MCLPGCGSPESWGQGGVWVQAVNLGGDTRKQEEGLRRRQRRDVKASGGSEGRHSGKGVGMDSILAQRPGGLPKPHRRAGAEKRRSPGVLLSA